MIQSYSMVNLCYKWLVSGLTYVSTWSSTLRASISRTNQFRIHAESKTFLQTTSRTSATCIFRDKTITIQCTLKRFLVIKRSTYRYRSMYRPVIQFTHRFFQCISSKECFARHTCYNIEIKATRYITTHTTDQWRMWCPFRCCLSRLHWEQINRIDLQNNT
jgi:hypothetical protein